VKKERKVEEVKTLTERLEKAKALIFTEYRGLKVSEMNELRTKLRSENSWFKVVKNRLMKKALKEQGLDSLLADFTGPTAVASSDADPIGPAKVIVNFAKGHEKLVIKGGFMEGARLGADEIDRLAKMPSREELLAKALGSMSAPARNLVGVLAAIPRKLVYAINAIKDTKQ